MHRMAMWVLASISAICLGLTSVMVSIYWLVIPSLDSNLVLTTECIVRAFWYHRHEINTTQIDSVGTSACLKIEVMYHHPVKQELKPGFLMPNKRPPSPQVRPYLLIERYLYN